MKTKRLQGAVAAMAAMFLVSAMASAQATRTWVSGVGDDANPCSRTAPCKTFAGAISKTAPAGEINVLDPGGFGGVTITKSLTISAEGVEAGVLVSGTNAIIVNAAPTDFVVLRGLDIEGLGTGLNGIRFLAGGSLQVENCTINRFTNFGIDFEPSGAAQLTVVNTILRNNLGALAGGILLRPGAAGAVTATFDHVVASRNRIGIRVEDRSKATARDSVATDSTNFGFHVFSAGAAAELNIVSSTASNNGIAGIRSEGAASIARLTDTTISDNATGLVSATSGQIVSFGNNRLAGNPTPGVPTSTVPQI